MTDIADRAGEGGGQSGSSKAEQAKETVQQTTQQAKETVQQTAEQATQQAREKAQEMRGQAAERLRQQVDERSTRTGSQLYSTADAVRRTGEQLRSGGEDVQANVADAVAERAQRLGDYLTGADADRILRDVENFARRQPWVTALGGAALGFFAARFMKASSSRRYESGDGARRYYAGELPPAPVAPTPIDYDVAGGAGMGYGVPPAPAYLDEPVGGRGRGGVSGDVER